MVLEQLWYPSWGAKQPKMNQDGFRNWSNKGKIATRLVLKMCVSFCFFNKMQHKASKGNPKRAKKAPMRAQTCSKTLKTTNVLYFCLSMPETSFFRVCFFGHFPHLPPTESNEKRTNNYKSEAMP